MICEIDWPPWISTIATIISAGTALAVWKVLKNLLESQKLIEIKKIKPSPYRLTKKGEYHS